MGSDIVTLVVGKKRKEFKVHKKLICEASKFFNDAFNGPFKEGKEGIMYMPEDDPDVITYLVDWLYRSPLPMVEDPANSDEEQAKKTTPISKSADTQFGPATKAEHEAQLGLAKKEEAAKKKALQARLDPLFDKLFRLYYFAEKLFINELKNQCMDRIRRGMCRYDRTMRASVCKQVYAHTTKESRLRKFCVDLVLFKLSDASEDTLDKIVTLQKQVPEFCKDILVKTKCLVQLEIEMEMDCCGNGHPDPRRNGSCGCGWSHDISPEIDIDMCSVYDWGHVDVCQYHDHGDVDCELSGRSRD